MFVRWLRSRPTLVKCLQWVGFLLFVAIVLGDLFVGGYRAVGPSVFGIACCLVGMMVIRYFVLDERWSDRVAASELVPPEPSPSSKVVEPDQGPPLVFFTVLWSVLGCGVGIMMLIYPMRFDVPENASIAWTFPPGERPVNRPFIRWERIRSEQCMAAPILLFIGGMSLAYTYHRFSSFCLSLLREPGARRGRSTPQAGGSAVTEPDPYPFALVLFLGLLFVIIALRMTVFPDV